jgi:hypothetical protein
MECSLTEMPVEMCSHCRGLDPKPVKVTMKFGHAFVAKFDGWCRWCKDEIESEEEKIVRVEFNEESGKEPQWVHDYCAKEMGLKG